jgi:hypothetical protein
MYTCQDVVGTSRTHLEAFYRRIVMPIMPGRRRCIG